jgi:Putative MetA-pathway of phenol degradation
LGTIVRIFPAWGTNDFRTHHVTGDLRLAADWDFASTLELSLNPNVGVGFYEDDRGNVFAAALFAVTLNYQPTKKLNPFIDFGLVAPEEKGGNSALIGDAGVAYIIGRNIEVDASVGNGAHGHTPPRPFLAFGLSFRSHGVHHR